MIHLSDMSKHNHFFSNAILCIQGNMLKIFFAWNWLNTVNTESALWLLMAWCFNTRASVTTMLITHLCVSSCWWVKMAIHLIRFVQRSFLLLVSHLILFVNAGVYTKFSGRLSEEPFPWLIQKFPCILIFKTGQPGCQLNLSEGQNRLDLTGGWPWCRTLVNLLCILLNAIVQTNTKNKSKICLTGGHLKI